MRDINRIERISKKIAKVWGMTPDWRFMQWVCNFQRSIGGDGFYMEDDKFEAILDKMIEDYEKNLH